MDTEGKAYITFGSQMGDQTATEVVQPQLIELRRLLKVYCNKEYAVDIEEFAPIARVDGDIWSWNFEGCQNLKFSKKGRYLTIDIGMPKSRWVGVEIVLIKKYLFENLEEALRQMVARLKKEKVDIDEHNLFADLERVGKIFLSEWI